MRKNGLLQQVPPLVAFVVSTNIGNQGLTFRVDTGADVSLISKNNSRGWEGSFTYGSRSKIPSEGPWANTQLPTWSHYEAAPPAEGKGSVDI